MQLVLWIGFVVLIGFFLVLDLGVFHKKNHTPTVKEAFAWTAVWVTMSLLFGGYVYFQYETNWLNMLSPDNPMLNNGKEALLKFYTGYFIEKSLSLDNIFVMAMIFTFFRIPLQYQHDVLFWGIIGAMVFRGLMIYAGATLIAQFYWINYVFGALLLYSAVQMLRAKQENPDLLRNPVARFITRFYPISGTLEGGKFFVKENGRQAVTVLFLALMLVETTDILFAIDSIPAIFAITTDPFLVFTSNIFAILGLRSLYFVLADVLDRFKYLKYSLIFILAYVGVKILLVHHYTIPTLLSLGVILGALVIGVVVSLLTSRSGASAEAPSEPDLPEEVKAEARDRQRATRTIGEAPTTRKPIL